MDISVRQKVLMLIVDKTRHLDWQSLSVVSTQQLAEALSLSRNMVSQYLNEFFNQGILIKINTRPVIFLHRRTLMDRMQVAALHTIYDSVEELLEDLSLDKEEDKCFMELIGSRNSLRLALEQCKAAITYPDHGLPILLQGKTGTGKSYLAQLLHVYAVEKGVVDKSRRFITINCAEYANNPEFFLTNLFGYKKGSYTGAEKDHDGLLSLADGGILFLDEVHALKPECQEKIFLFMDKGIYHMVGDNDTWYKADVRFLFATTEDPEASLLHTLLRRIPIIVQLPSLAERPLQEKRELMYTLFKKEEKKIKKHIYLSEVVYQALVHATFSGNVGELQNVIKTIVANAYMTSIKEAQVPIHLCHLPADLLQSVTANSSILKYDEQKMMGIEQMMRMDLVDPMLMTLYKELAGSGAHIAVTDVLLTQGFTALEAYSDYLLYDDSMSSQTSLFAHVVENLWHVIAQKFQMDDLSQTELTVLSGFLLDHTSHSEACRYADRRYGEICKHHMGQLKEQYPTAVAAAVYFSQLLQDSLKIQLQSVGIYALLLLILRTQRELERVHLPVLIIAHGYRIATSIAEFVNQLLQRKIFDAIDMPINCGMDIILNKASAYLKRYLGERQEVLLMVDMGSLEEAYRHMDHLQHADVGIVNNVTTKLALDIGGMIMEGYDMETILKEACERNQHRYMVLRNKTKPNAVFAICPSGFGTAEKVKRLLLESLPVDVDIKVIAYEYDMLDSLQSRTTIFEKYNVLFIVGTKDPQLSQIPFISLEELIEQRNLGRILELLKDHMDTTQILQFNRELIRRFSMESLWNYITVLNPEIILNHVEKIMERMEQGLHICLKSDVKVGLYIHISCLIERMIISKSVVSYEKLDELRLQHADFIQITKDSFHEVEKMYNVCIPEAEIGYLYEYIYDNSVDVLHDSVGIQEDFFAKLS